MEFKPVMTYALRDNSLVHISEVESGLKCDCYCPACGSKLVARKGNIKVAHFAHHTKEECAHGYETSLHIAAKNILVKHKELMLPALYLYFPLSFKNNVVISDEKKIQIDDIYLEKNLHDIIPDVIVETKNKKLLVEIYVTHKIDDQKLKKIRKLGLSTLEINLSSSDVDLTPDEIYQAIVVKSDNKEWIYNSLQEKYYKKFIESTEHLYRKKQSNYINNCPIGARIWKGIPNAHINYDCLQCRFCVERHDDYVLCSGKSRIAIIEDFGKSHDQRVTYYNREFERIKMESISTGRCPLCGYSLVNRHGPQGSFIGCSNYPDCHFTINIDQETGEMKIRDKL